MAPTVPSTKPAAPTKQAAALAAPATTPVPAAIGATGTSCMSGAVTILRECCPLECAGLGPVGVDVGPSVEPPDWWSVKPPPGKQELVLGSEVVRTTVQKLMNSTWR